MRGQKRNSERTEVGRSFRICSQLSSFLPLSLEKQNKSLGCFSASRSEQLLFHVRTIHEKLSQKRVGKLIIKLWGKHSTNWSTKGSSIKSSSSTWNEMSFDSNLTNMTIAVEEKAENEIIHGAIQRAFNKNKLIFNNEHYKAIIKTILSFHNDARRTFAMSSNKWKLLNERRSPRCKSNSSSLSLSVAGWTELFFLVACPRNGSY